MSSKETAIKENRITEGVIWKEILRYAAPLLVGNLFQQLYNTVDSIIVGRFVGTNALAAVSAGMYVIFMLIGFFMGIAGGCGVVLAQRYGAKDRDGAQKTIHTAISFMFLSSIFVSVLGYLVSPGLLRLINTPEEILEDSITYLQIFFAGCTALIMYNIGAGMLQAVGDARRPLYYLIVATVSNIILDLVFVVYFHMGVAGVAIATITAEAISAVLAIRALMKDDDIYKVSFKNMRIDKDHLVKILKVGLPAGLQQCIISFSNVVIQGYVNIYGAAVVAGIGAYNKIDAFVVLPMQSLCLAATTFVGQNLGAGKMDRVKKVANTSRIMGLGITAVLSIALIFGTEHMLRLFTTDREAIARGIQYMWYLAPFYVVLTWTQITASIIRGAGQTFIPMLIMVGNNCGLRLIWLYVANKIAPSLEITLINYPVIWVTAALLMTLYYFKGHWAEHYR